MKVCKKEHKAYLRKEFKMSNKIFTEFLQVQCSYFQKHQTPLKFSKAENNKAAVIIEPRKHPLLEAVIRNIMFHLGDGWNLHIWSHPSRRDWISTLLPKWEFQFHNIPFENMNQTLYNGYLLDSYFWHSFTEEHILVFQTDCIMFHPFDAEFLKYDYTGANYYNPTNVSKRIGGIQGGFSLRKKAAMIRCLREFQWNMIDRVVGDKHEDVFFTHACDILNCHVPKINDRKFFAIEAEWFERPMAHHGFHHRYFTEDQARAIIDQSLMNQLMSCKHTASCP